MSVQIIRADARDLPLEDGSVDLVVTSPPYFALRSYQDGGEHYDGQIGSEPTPAEFLDALIAVTAECVRVLKPSGSIFVNLGDKYVADNRGSGGDRKRGEAKHAPVGPAGFPGRDMARQKSLMGLPWRYALRCIDDLGLILRAEIIWSKPNGLPESVRDRVRRSHEQWFHFTVSPRYFSAVDEIREGYAPGTAKRYASGYNATAYQTGQVRRDIGVDYSGSFDENPLGKLPGSVRSVPTQPLKVPAELGIDHFAAFPTAWPLWFIKGWCPTDGVVLDPFGGTGTTALAADVLGRQGISVDLSADYCRLAEWRTSDPKERAKALKKAAEIGPPKPAEFEQTSIDDAA